MIIVQASGNKFMKLETGSFKDFKRIERIYIVGITNVEGFFDDFYFYFELDGFVLEFVDEVVFNVYWTCSDAVLALVNSNYI
jgi:hypothetical protein